MPISASDADDERYGEPNHWRAVQEGLFVPAVEAAGFTPVRPAAEGTVVITANIVQQLQNADMVLCDLSNHNPNVFFELGVRTVVNRPITLVIDEHTRLPFDISTINTHHYQSSPRWGIDVERNRLTEHLKASRDSCGGKNPMWQQFGLTVTAERLEEASEKEPRDAKLDLLLQKVDRLEHESLRKGPVRAAALDVGRLVPIDLPLTSSTRADLAPNVVAFLRRAEVLRNDDGELPTWLVDFDSGRVFLFKDEFDGLPIASRRIIGDYQREHNVDFTVI